MPAGRPSRRFFVSGKSVQASPTLQPIFKGMVLSATGTVTSVLKRRTLKEIFLRMPRACRAQLRAAVQEPLAQSNKDWLVHGPCAFPGRLYFRGSGKMSFAGSVKRSSPFSSVMMTARNGLLAFYRRLFRGQTPVLLSRLFQDLGVQRPHRPWQADHRFGN
jgi:hypothetical protein